MPKVYTLEPSELVAHVDIGQTFVYEDTGRVYLLIGRDPWKAYLIRWTWWRELTAKGFRNILLKRKAS